MLASYRVHEISSRDALTPGLSVLRTKVFRSLIACKTFYHQTCAKTSPILLFGHAALPPRIPKQFLTNSGEIPQSVLGVALMSIGFSKVMPDSTLHVMFTRLSGSTTHRMHTPDRSLVVEYVIRRPTGGHRVIRQHRVHRGAGFNDHRSTRSSARAASESRIRPRISS